MMTELFNTETYYEAKRIEGNGGSRMSSYKGWTPAERSASLRKTNKAIKEGIIPKATKCEICGQTEGIIQYHNEDYSHPTKYLKSWCWRCHMMHHSIKRNSKAVEYYFERMARGEQDPPVHVHDFGILRRDYGIY